MEENMMTEEVSKIVCELQDVVDKNMEDIQFKGLQIHGDKEQVSALMTSFSKYFAEVTNPKNTKVNPFLKNKYAPLDEVLNVIRPTMSNHGLSFMQIPTLTDTQDVKVDTLLMHESGAYMAIEGIAMKPAKQTAQDVGAVLTYCRRYIISCIGGVSSEEDEDGNDKGKGGKKSSEPTDEDVSKLTFPTLKAKTTTLAKDKMAKDKAKVDVEIAKALGVGNKLASTTESDKEKVVGLYLELQKL